MNRQNAVTMRTKTVVGTTAAAINGPVRWVSLSSDELPAVDITVAVGVTVGSPAGTMGACWGTAAISYTSKHSTPIEECTYLCSQSW